MMMSISTTISSTILMAIVIWLQQSPVGGTLYKNDRCYTKGMLGTCLSWVECPIMKSLIERRQYSQSEVVNCGFNNREELICCPQTNIKSTTEKDFGPAVLNGNGQPTEISPTTIGGREILPVNINAQIGEDKKVEQFIRDFFEKHIKRNSSRAETSKITTHGDNLDQLIKDVFKSVQISGNASFPNASTGHMSESEGSILLRMGDMGDDTLAMDANERPAVRACHRIQNGLKRTGVTSNISRSTTAVLGEFPHTVAIGYSLNGQDSYEFLCAGTLIDSRFVLTAAHCVASGNPLPSIIRMGVVNNSDPDEIRSGVEIRIKLIHFLISYSRKKVYNDIGILELERPVDFSEFIYPACLNTDESDLPSDVKLWATGWGQTNRRSRVYSMTMQKSPVYITPLDKCNSSFLEYGLTRKINRGIIESQLCAVDENELTEACQGMSGGPLSLIDDGPFKSHRLVGVVSFGCHDSLPTIYSRVASYLEFIEQIVWPTRN